MYGVVSGMGFTLADLIGLATLCKSCRRYGGGWSSCAAAKANERTVMSQ